MLILGFFLLNGVLVVGAQPKGIATPENITVQLIDSKTVEVFWSTAWKNVERYYITYNPTENRVVSQAAGNSHSIILRELRPNTQYQVTVTAVVEGKSYKSRRLAFKTSADPSDSLDLEEIKPVPTKPSKSRKTHPITPEIINPDPTAIGSKYTPPTSTTVRGVEIGLVLLALVVWIIAIALFFHRWGKIRMLLPYQPDYKTQQSLKVPGTGTTIVSGCTGNSSSQGQQEGPSCVQHLRWSTRFFEETSTAKKCSPTRRPLRSRVSSAIFPASPSYYYARTSAGCDSPRIIRHAYSHSEFPTESIHLSQVNQPRSENSQNVISITVPVLASNVNEKKHNNKNEELKSNEKANFNENAILNFDESVFSKKDKNETNFLSSLGDDISGQYPLGAYYSRNIYQSIQNSTGQQRSEWQKKNAENASELEPLFFIESSDTRFLESPIEEVNTLQESEKPKRYCRSSFKKQKVRLYDDRDSVMCKTVPIYECEWSSQDKNQKSQESENQKNRKMQEMRRKAFLRKVSLQDTYLNYNQDYWLDFKKSGRFHKSIDLGCFGMEDKSNKMETQEFKIMSDEGRPNSIWEEQFSYRIARSNQFQPLAIKNQSNVSSKFTSEGGLKRSDSDPIIFPSKCPCENCQRNDSNESMASSKKKKTETETSGFFLTSNENIPLFSERNGLIETDFDMLNLLDEECLLLDKFPKEGGDNYNHKVFYTGETDLGLSTDFSDFYEIKLTQSSEPENETSESRIFNFEGGKTSFETFASTPGSSDDSYKETDPLRTTEGGSSDFSFFFRSSSCLPKSSSD